MRIFALISIALAVLSMGCSEDKNVENSATSAENRSIAELMSAILPLREITLERSKWPEFEGEPANEDQLRKVEKLLSGEFVDIYKLHNGLSHMGILFRLKSIEEIETQSSSDLSEISDLRIYWPEFTGSNSQYVLLGDGNEDSTYYHRPTGRIITSHGGEDLSVFHSVSEWLASIEQELIWLNEQKGE